MDESFDAPTATQLVTESFQFAWRKTKEYDGSYSL